MHIHAVLCDFDGVLRHWDPEGNRRAEAAGGLPPGALARAAFASECLGPAIRGEVSDEAWRDDVARRLSEQVTPTAARAAVEAWSASTGEVVPEVFELVQRVRRGRRLVLVTNATSRLPRDLEALGLSDAFDAVVNSSEVGAAKPSPAIYHAALEQAGAPAERAVFVDDSAANVEAARELGIASHCFRDAASLAQWFAELGL